MCVCVCVCVPKAWLWASTKFQLEILIRNTILVIYKFRENILESSQKVSETPPGVFSTQSSEVQLSISGVPPLFTLR